MCTAITFRQDDLYFCRNLDLDRSYGEAVTVTPRRFPFSFRCQPPQESHLAIIGTAHIADGCPLYYDAVNEAGVCIAALRFARSAVYHPYRPGAHNVASFELIPWLLGQCADLPQARRLLARTSVMEADFRPDLPSTPLHWLLADRSGALVLESTADGLLLHENPVGVLTNEPPFPYHLLRLSDFLPLSSAPAKNRFSKGLPLFAHSHGSGAVGLPGDLTSSSRFVRAAFTKQHALCGGTEEARVTQCFHILSSVEQVHGCVQTEEGRQMRTVYSACCNADKGVYYYTTYENRQITAVYLHNEDLDAAQPVSYPLVRNQQIRSVN